MASDGSVTHWLGQLQAGDPDAAQPLWERYFAQLVELARKKLANAPRRAADEEDVALSVLDSFCRRAQAGQFPRLADRDNLWRLLVTLTARKATDLARRESRRKRGGGAVLDEAALASPPGPAAQEVGLEQMIGREPSPEFAALVAEECQRLLDLLDDPALRSVAVWRMEGYANAEIAARLGTVERTVERKLQMIRKVWGEEGAV